jgi:PAT family beta-lactamase induction signal transducer AmpG
MVLWIDFIDCGGIIGGIVISKDGLGKWMLPMILAMHLPILGFVALAHFHPSTLYLLCTLLAEQFGLRFWLCSFFMMYLIYVADGESKTSHYSIATGFMALGMMLPGMASGFIQEIRLRKLLYLGVSSHYSWINSVILDFPYDFGKKSETSK